MLTVPHPVIDALAEHRQRQLGERLKAKHYENNDFVFATCDPFHPQANGGPIQHRNLHRRHMLSIPERAKLPATFHLYCLRYSFATLALASGVDAKDVSVTLGHSSVAFTMDTYYHLIPSLREATAQRIENLFFGRNAAAVTP